MSFVETPNVADELHDTLHDTWHDTLQTRKTNPVLLRFITPLSEFQPSYVYSAQDTLSQVRENLIATWPEQWLKDGVKSKATPHLFFLYCGQEFGYKEEAMTLEDLDLVHAYNTMHIVMRSKKAQKPRESMQKLRNLTRTFMRYCKIS